MTFEPVESSDFSQKSSLVLNRSDSSIVLHGSPPFARNNILDAFIPIANDRKERLLVYGLLGFISINQGWPTFYSISLISHLLHLGDLLIVATKREKAGVWNGHAVYKLTGYKIIPVHSVPTLVSPLQVQCCTFVWIDQFSLETWWFDIHKFNQTAPWSRRLLLFLFQRLD